MVRLIQQGEVRHSHIVTALQDIGPFKKFDTLQIKIQPMQGRIYQPGKDKEGKWIDTIGKNDERLMVTSDVPPFYKVFENWDEIHNTFNED